jgi:aryl-alcohol dehydrogenase-like predicted oxidoreductase
MSIGGSRRGFLAGTFSMAVAGAQSKDPEMPRRVLGKTGLKVSVLGFGCIITSDPAVLDQAFEAGVNYFDTARGYQNGANERMVGAALRKHRKNLVLSTKSRGRTKPEMLADLDTSLKELGTDCVDIWYMHDRSTPGSAPDECFEAQEEAVKAGKARFRGISLHGGFKEMTAFMTGKGRTDVVMTSYNFTMDPEMDALVDQLAAAGIGVVAMKVMAGGFRTNKPGSPMHERLSRQGAPAAALKWAVRRPSIHTSVPGMVDLDQFDENFRAVATGWKPEDARVLAAHLKAIGPLYCRMCGRCAGQCPRGLPVSDIIRYVSYAEGYGQYELGLRSYLELPEELRGVRCSDCSRCAIQCPNGVRVAQRAGRAQELFA